MPGQRLWVSFGTGQDPGPWLSSPRTRSTGPAKLQKGEPGRDGRRESLLIHPRANAPAHGSTPGIDVAFGVLLPGAVTALRSAYSGRPCPSCTTRPPASATARRPAASRASPPTPQRRSTSAPAHLGRDQLHSGRRRMEHRRRTAHRVDRGRHHAVRAGMGAARPRRRQGRSDHPDEPGSSAAHRARLPGLAGNAQRAQSARSGVPPDSRPTSRKCSPKRFRSPRPARATANARGTSANARGTSANARAWPQPALASAMSAWDTRYGWTMPGKPAAGMRGPWLIGYQARPSLTASSAPRARPPTPQAPLIDGMRMTHVRSAWAGSPTTSATTAVHSAMTVS
jgi:hypothetical protein